MYIICIFIFIHFLIHLAAEEITVPTTPLTTEIVSSGIYIAAQSGAFNVSTTWSGGLIPSGECSIVIPSGITVTFTGEILDINVQTLTVAGTFAIASSASVGFTFKFAINIIVQAGGIFQDQTTAHQLFFLAGSLCTFYPGTLFFGSSTVVFTYQTLPATGSLGANYTFGSSFSGPFTFGILLDGSIQTFTKVTFIAAISGNFTETNTWLGGIVPNESICSLVGGCGLYISSGCVLSTASLNGQLNINFNLITISSGGTFELGAADCLCGFRFQFEFRFDIYGVLKYLPLNTDGIFLPIGTAFNFYANASFVSNSSITLISYDPVTNVTVGVGISISSSFSGPYFALISENGDIVTNSVRE